MHDDTIPAEQAAALNATILALSSSDGREKCDLCGRRVKLRWSVLISGVIAHSNTKSQFDQKKECCIVCAALAEERGHTVLRGSASADPTVPGYNILRFKLRAAESG